MNTRSIIANFTDLSTKDLQGIIDRDQARSGEKYPATIHWHEFSGCTSVTGDPQAIMFIIGAVAAEGWDCLRSVHTA